MNIWISLKAWGSRGYLERFSIVLNKVKLCRSEKYFNLGPPLKWITNLEVYGQLKSELIENLEISIDRYFKGIADVNSEYWSNQLKLANERGIIQLSELSLKVLCKLPTLKFGQLVTYSDLANSLKLHPRAIGRIMSINPYPLLLPCHRVISRSGPGGYTAGLLLKVLLILHEHTQVHSSKVCIWTLNREALTRK